MAGDVLELGAFDAARALRRKEVSAVEVVRACLAEIEKRQPSINCFISWDAEAALEAARAADRDAAAGKWHGPLHGVPLAWKDMFLRRGRVSTFGSKICRDFVATTTATVIERLESAGAILLGGLNMGEFAISPTGHNEHFGHCRNPWNTARITGGSSSGSAAAVAARVVFGALGSDTGGSVRLPAAICGVVGIKPTNGRVSRYGCMPRAWSLDTVGPIARTVRDCALLLRVIAGHDPRDPTTSDHAIDRYDELAATDLRGMKIAIPAGDAFWTPESELRPAYEGCIDGFRALSAQIVESRLPDVHAYYDPANVINKVEGAAAHAHWMRTRRDEYSASALSRLEAGLHVPATHYLDALRARTRLLREFVGTVFKTTDLLCLPVLGIKTPTIEETEFRGSASQPELVEKITRFTRWLNYLGLPALGIPCGFTADLLPVGCQLVGRPYSEHRLFQAGHAYQDATAWHLQRPSDSSIGST